MTPTAYVAEDGLVGHQWEEKPLVLPTLDPSVGECHGGGKEGGWGREHPYIRGLKGLRSLWKRNQERE